MLEQAAREMLCYRESGMSVMEMSHRSPVCEGIIAEAEKLLREVMLTQITTAFSADHINIENLANGSKGEVAYTIVETAQSVGQEVLSRVQQIDGVIRVLCY